MIHRMNTKRLLLLSGALFIACLLTAYLTSYHLHAFTFAPSFLEPQCRCELNKNTHDFCYRLPLQPHIRGQPFNCAYATYLDQLDLLSTENSINLETDQFPDPMYVTAMSDSHFEEGLTLIANIRKLWPQKKVLVYNLGLDQRSVEELKICIKKCLVELRNFPFSDYPSYVNKLQEYRWKPLIIAMAVKEFGAIWWMDTSVRWKKDYHNLIYDEMRCRNNSSSQLPTSSNSTSLLWTGRNATRCEKSAYLLQLVSGHSTFATTNPGVYKYIPTVIKRSTCENYGATFAFILRTKTAITILKWLVLCALEKNCMAPPGSELFCKFGPDRYKQYAKCHRYDQSVINLLLENMYGCNPDKYVSRFGGQGVDVERYASHSLTAKDFLCN